MKKILPMVLCTALLMTMSGCSDKESSGSEAQDKKSPASNSEAISSYNKTSLKKQAYDILDSLSDDARVNDFIRAYDILENLPSEKDAFLSELKKVQDIAAKYDIELHYLDYLLTPYNSLDNSDDDMYSYLAAGSDERKSDIRDLIEKLVYPAISDAYGESAEHLPNIDIDSVRSSINKSGFTELYKTDENYDTITEEWKNPSDHAFGTWEVEYYSNDYVKSVTIPLVHADNPLNDDDFYALFESSLDEQKKQASPRFENMVRKFEGFCYGADILNSLLSNEELDVLDSFITSLDAESIWENDMLHYVDAGVYYTNAAVNARYGGKNIYFNFNPNNISMEITCTNHNNEAAQKYYTVLCGLLNLSDVEYSSYQSYLSGDETESDTAPEWSIDLAVVESQYTESYYYDMGCKYLDSNQYLDAMDSFSHNLNYLDSEEKYKEANYLYGEELLDTGDPKGAADYFLCAGDYKDASTRVQQYYFENAEKLFNEQDYLTAAEAYSFADTYSDADTKILECYYCYGVQQMDMNNSTDAVTYLSKCRGYKNTDEILLSYYYLDASNAVDTLLYSFSQDSFTADIDASYKDAKSKLELCEGYRDSKDLLKVVETLYYVWKETPSATNHVASLNSMTTSYSGNIVQITRENFVSGTSCTLSLSYNIMDNTFEANITNMFNLSARESDAQTVISGLLVLFSEIDDTSDFDMAFSDISNWLISDKEESFSMHYSDYNISVQTKSERTYYIDCKISVSK